MPFLPALSHYRYVDNSPRCRLHVSRVGQRDERRRLTFVLTRQLVEKLEWQGGERIVVSIGTGEDLGAFQFARVDKAKAGSKLIPNSRAHGFRLHITLPPEIHGIRPAEFLDRLPLPVTLEWSIRDGALELRSQPAEAGAIPSNITALRS